MTAVAAYTRAKTGRKPLSPDLPRIIVTHDVPEEDKICACGCQKIIMKEIVSEKLVKPRSSPYVIKDIRYARVCPECEGTATEGISPTVETAPVQNQLISKSIATSSLVADIMDLKFNNSLPFYRISNMLKTDGISVTRATMCNWTIKISARLKPMMELFHEKLMESSVIFADETTLQVNKEPGRKPSSKSYVWVLRSGGINAPPTVYFHYEPSRAQKVAIKLLSGYKGHLMTDGFDGYNFTDKKNSNITHLCCWAHCRRKFYDAYKILDEKQRKRSYSFLAIKYIQKIYKVEEDIRNRLNKGENLTADQIFSIRIQNSKPVLEKLERRLKQWQGKVTPKSLTGIAVRYALNMWSKLIRYLEDGNLPIDNNPAENALRSLCVSRKNWLFCDTPEGADAAAIMLSLISTCKANGMQPYWYMRYLFDHLPGFKTKDDFKAFMPQVMDKTVLEDYIKKTNIQDQENLKIALEQSHTEK